jgi:hypothetical protein
MRPAPATRLRLVCTAVLREKQVFNQRSSAVSGGKFLIFNF